MTASNQALDPWSLWDVPEETAEVRFNDHLTVTFPPMQEGQTDWKLSLADFCPEGPVDVLPAISPDLSYGDARIEFPARVEPDSYRVGPIDSEAAALAELHMPPVDSHGRDSTERDPLISPYGDDLKRAVKPKSRHSYRHPNGGALCYGFDHDLSADTYASNSLIEGKTITTKSTIRGSQIENCVLTNALIESCWLSDCVIRNSHVFSGVQLDGAVVDDAILWGPWRLEGLARIHRGGWTRPPRFLQIETENLSVGITECTDGCANISSRCHKIEDWLKYGPRLGRMLGWSEREIEMARQFLESLR